MPAATLDIDNFFNIKANATKLGDFFLKIIWQQFDMTRHCPRDLMFPWQPYSYFDRHVFFKISISLILKLNKSFLVAFLSV